MKQTIISILKAILLALGDKPSDFDSSGLQPIIRREIDFWELLKLLKEKFPDAEIYISDSVESLCDIEDIETFLERDETNRQKYLAEKFDCDDFAYRLMGQFSVPGWSELAFGIVWTDVHAMNIVVDANLDLWFIEPQNDTVQSSLEAWQGQKIRFIAM